MGVEHCDPDVLDCLSPKFLPQQVTLMPDRRFFGFLITLTLTCFTPSLSWADNQTVPGEVTTPYPTIHNLAVEWSVQGDDNANGTCDVQFRKVGEQTWKAAMPLRRVPAGENTSADPDRSWTQRFSGSIFNLQDDTEYEIELKLVDPDGGDVDPNGSSENASGTSVPHGRSDGNDGTKFTWTGGCGHDRQLGRRRLR